MTIQISDLRLFSEKIFAHLEKSGHQSIELDDDYYWVIHRSALYDAGNEPSNFYLGQLFDDYESIKKVANDVNEPLAYYLINFSALLRYIGEKIVS